MSDSTVVRMADDQSECSHTPGPWSAECVMDNDPHDICAPSLPGMGSPNLIATVLYDPEDESDMTLVQANSNARLIAAAPELLALARKLASECAGCGGSAENVMNTSSDRDPANDFAVPCEDCKDIWAVINKAEGRS